MIPCRQDRDALLFEVQVQPRARRPCLLGVHDGALKVGVAAPAERGRANEALVKILAELLGLRRAQVSIVRGEFSRRKLVRAAGVKPETLQSLVEGRSTEG